MGVGRLVIFLLQIFNCFWVPHGWISSLYSQSIQTVIVCPSVYLCLFPNLEAVWYWLFYIQHHLRVSTWGCEKWDWMSAPKNRWIRWERGRKAKAFSSGLESRDLPYEPSAPGRTHLATLTQLILVVCSYAEKNPGLLVWGTSHRSCGIEDVESSKPYPKK